MKKVDIDQVMQILIMECDKLHVPVVDLIKIQTNDPFKVLIATILSARTKDETTGSVSERLFKTVKSPADFRKYSIPEIEKLIFPVGFYKNKAKFLKQLPDVLDEKFGGIIPDTVEELVELPGVGRKTANLVVAVAFEKPAICVDTHVHKITNRLGYVRTKTPFDTEMALRKKAPIRWWKEINRVFVTWGQSICTPTSPHCSKCALFEHCNRVGVNRSR
ncbi:endonuclease III [Candidatus Woesearchaeota archaeon]|nr:endonuclease III [Candidatus Woesearchaeota archaeon]